MKSRFSRSVRSENSEVRMGKSRERNFPRLRDGASTSAQTGQYERRLFGPTRLERQIRDFLADPSATAGHLVPPVPVQVVRRQRLVHQPQDLRLIRTIDGRHGYVPDGPEPTAVVQVFVLQPEEIPHEPPVADVLEGKNKIEYYYKITRENSACDADCCNCCTVDAYSKNARKKNPNSSDVYVRKKN